MTTKIQLTEAQILVMRRTEAEAGQPIDQEREPLPPGDPVTWGAIIANTCLAGASYTPPRGV